jgi:hypothetical protein
VGAVHFYRVLSRVLKAAHTSPSAHGTLLDRLGAEDLSPLWYLLAAFAVVWLYSVIDAYRTGKKMDREGEKATP